MRIREGGAHDEYGLDLGVEGDEEADPSEDSARDGPEEEVLDVELLLEQRHVVEWAECGLEAGVDVGAKHRDLVAINLPPACYQLLCYRLIDGTIS